MIRNFHSTVLETTKKRYQRKIPLFLIILFYLSSKISSHVGIESNAPNFVVVMAPTLFAF